ncbi:MAG: hypothetical protein WBD41_14365 [Rhodococcus sp. (in: high G+C Gram-positive bacteria)]
MTEFVGAVAGFVLGLLVGQFIRFRRVDRDGHRVLKPELDTRPLRSRILNLALVVMFVVSLGMTLWANYTQRECNGQFQGSLKNNAGIGAQDRALEVRDDALRDKRDDALGRLIEALLAPTTAYTAERVLDVLEVYRDTVRDNDAERTQLNAERRELEQQRRANPYPEARC